jgi:membrane-associated phospholipid phosphatase
MEAYLHPHDYVLIGIFIMAAILVQRRWRLAVLVVIFLGAAPVAAEILKDLLDYPRLRPFTGAGQAHVAPPSWPSGHATAAAALGLAVTVAAPRPLRWYGAALGALLVGGVSADLLVGGAHFPSDVLGGYLLAGAWFCLLMAALRPSRSRFPRPLRHIGECVQPMKSRWRQSQ